MEKLPWKKAQSVKLREDLSERLPVFVCACVFLCAVTDMI